MRASARRAAEAASWTTAALTLEQEYGAMLGAQLSPAPWPAAGAWAPEPALAARR